MIKHLVSNVVTTLWHILNLFRHLYHHSKVFVYRNGKVNMISTLIEKHLCVKVLSTSTFITFFRTWLDKADSEESLEFYIEKLV